MSLIEKYRDISQHIYFWLMVLLAVSLPFSAGLATIIMIILSINWIIEGNWKVCIKKLTTHKSLMVFLCIFAIYLFWLPTSNNFQNGLDDLIQKLPLFILPIIIGTSEPLETKRVRLLLRFFIAAVVLSTFYSMAVYYGIVKYEISDIRDISVFVPHVYLSVLVTVVILTILHWIKTEGGHIGKHHILYILLILWLVFFLFLLKSLTGVVVLFVTTFILILILLDTIENQFLKVWLIVIMYAIPFFSAIVLLNAYNSFFEEKDSNLSNLEKYTPGNRMYYHDTTSYLLENGHKVWIYVCEPELEKEWKRRSHFDYNGHDLKGQPLNQTLIRYMTSKGLRKDSVGLWQLSNRDIANIQHGLTNHIFEKNWSIYPRIYESIWELHNYLHTGKTESKTLAQRYIDANIAFQIIKQHFWVGTGNSDIDKKHKSVSQENYQKWNVHNQYLRIFMAFGLFGLIIFIGALAIPPFMERRWISYYFLMIFLIIVLTFLNEDALENSTGIFIVSYFYSLFMWGSNKRLL